MTSIIEKLLPPERPALFDHTVILKDDWNPIPSLRDWANFGKDLICRVAHLHGVELENLALMVLLCVPKKRGWDFYKNGGWILWFSYKPGQECLP